MVLLVFEVVDQAGRRFSEFGAGFLTTSVWNRSRTVRRGRSDLGHACTSFVALLIAVPVAIAIALFLTELAPRVLRTPVGMMVELLAAIPSVVLGLWGILMLGPFLNDHVEPWMISHLGFIPFLDGYPSPVGLLPACLILTIMIVPIVASISREFFQACRANSRRERSPWARPAGRWCAASPSLRSAGAWSPAVMLGFARAVGEAIAVTQVIGGSLVRPQNLYAPADTMASRLAAQYAGTPTTLGKASLAYLAVILLVISLITNLVAKLIVRRIRAKDGDSDERRVQST